MVCALGHQRVGLIGLSFKPGTDDFRESPLVLLAEGLLGKGFKLKIYDSDVVLGKILGANKQFVESAIPHLSALLTDRVEDVLDTPRRWSSAKGLLRSPRPSLVQRQGSACSTLSDFLQMRYPQEFATRGLSKG